jgi:hypothetical protein
MLNTMRGVNWIYLAEDRDMWFCLNIVMNFRVPQNVKSFVTEEQVCRRYLLFEIFQLQQGLL